MKSAIACLLTLALVIPAEARERTPLEQAKKIALGSRVLVELKNQHTVSGRLREVTGTRFTIESLVPGKATRTELLFQDVSQLSSLEQTKKDVLLSPVKFIVFFFVCGLGAIVNKPCEP